MTKQEFYRICVERTIKRSAYDENSPLYDVAASLDMSKMTFNEVLMRLELCGIHIPQKEDFRGWGVGYLCQLLVFVREEDDCQFTKQFFSFLDHHRGLLRNQSVKDEFGAACYDMYVDCIMDRSTTFTSRLATFILTTFKDGGYEWWNDFIILVRTFGRIDQTGFELFFDMSTPRKEAVQVAGGQDDGIAQGVVERIAAMDCDKEGLFVGDDDSECI